MTIRQATNAEIRVSLGHGEGTRRVKISRNGEVSYYGSRDPFDRSLDCWHDGRWASEYNTNTETNLTWF